MNIFIFPDFKRRWILLTLTATFLATTVFAASKIGAARFDECEVAKIWYDLDTNAEKNALTFSEYLDDVLRFGSDVSTVNSFSNSRYSVAIHSLASGSYKSHDFFLSRSGIISSGRSISISEREWSNHQKLTC